MPPVLQNVSSEKDLSNPKNGHRMSPGSKMAYVNISSDGAKSIGPIGLKKAEKELI